MKQFILDQTIPSGYCKCGCGQKTNIAKRSYKASGVIKGEPFPYVLGHTAKARGGPEVPVGMKWCYKCREIKDLSEFYVAKRNANGVQSFCKSCARDISSSWRSRNRTVNRRYGLNWRLKYKFNMSLDEYNVLLETQEHKCAICGRPEMVTRNGIPKMMCIDHDHDTGKVRGLLCNNCNRGIGLIGEDPDWLQKAINYLSSNK